VRVLRIYHGGRNAAHRARERALQEAGADVALVVPSAWPDELQVASLADERVPIFELPVVRPGDVNRHAYLDAGSLSRTIRAFRPDVLDIHEEPFSVVARQCIAMAPRGVQIVMYTAQNVDKRFPPPYAQYERAAHHRVAALYPCSAQAASVARGKGFSGLIDVLPLGCDASTFSPGTQSLDDAELVLGFFGRLVPEKGAADALRVLERLHRERPTRLIVVGDGPEEPSLRAQAAALGLADRVDLFPWQPPEELARLYQTAHVVLVPSRPTQTWVEQFGRVIVEAQASGAVVAGYASGAIPEVAGEAAILAEVGAVSQLADGVAEMVLDPAGYARRREHGIALSRMYTWTQVAEHQAELYRRVAAGEAGAVRLPRSPRRRREAARLEFGPTAATIAGIRPFALPLLRRGGLAAATLGSLIDAGGELAAPLSTRGGSERRPAARSGR
jgi:glycosyltransferase involved in cell wall biosynthesis